jgi:hypothetical protein
MEKEFVPYDQALALKELGFDNIKCLGIYYGEYEHDIDYEDGFILSSSNTQYYAQKRFQNGILAPLYQQAFRWFREEHDLYGRIDYEDDLKSKWGSSVEGYYETWGKYDLGFTGWVNTYKEAELACLEKLIKIVKEKNKES